MPRSTAQGGPNIITEGLVVHLDAANRNSYAGSGTIWTDLTSNNNRATIIGTTTFSTVTAGGIDFDGSGPTSPAFSIPNPTITTEAFLVDVWITQRLPLTSSTDNIRGILSCGDLWNSPSPGLFPGWAIGYLPAGSGAPYESSSFNGGGRFYSGSANEFSVFARIGVSNNKIFTGSVYNLVLHRNTIDEKIYFYINGVLNGSTNLGNQYSMSGSQAIINARVWEAGSIDSPKATYHNIKVYKGKNFTDAERLQNYNALKYRFGL
jgi:hypothetical protein